MHLKQFIPIFLFVNILILTANAQLKLIDTHATEHITIEPTTTEPITVEPTTTEPNTTKPATTEPNTTKPSTIKPSIFNFIFPFH